MSKAKIYSTTGSYRKNINYNHFTTASEFISMQQKIFDHSKRSLSYIYGIGRRSTRNRQDFKIAFSYQVVKKNGVDSYDKGVRVVSANRFLAALI